MILTRENPKNLYMDKTFLIFTQLGLTTKAHRPSGIFLGDFRGDFRDVHWFIGTIGFESLILYLQQLSKEIT